MDLSQKSPFAVTMTNYIQNKIDTNQETFGWQLPCRVVKVAGAIVTVAFEIDQSNKLTFPQVECAIAQSIYVRLPVQVGDFGICVAANARLGGVNGLGSGVAPLSNPLNLEGLVYVPIGNANWSAVDPTATTITDKTGATSVSVSPAAVNMQANSLNISGNVVPGTGVNGSFTTGTGQIVTVQNGIIVNIY